MRLKSRTSSSASIVAAGTGISWLNLAPDYSRYLPRSERGVSVIGWVTLGAVVPTVGLVVIGYLAAAHVDHLAAAVDPVGSVRAALPSWIAVPYLLAAAGGMLAETDLALYSSGLNLLVLGIPVRRTRTVVIDALVVFGGGMYLMTGRSGFMGPFESFLELLAAGIAAWAGVVLADMVRARSESRRAAASPGAGGSGSAGALDLHYGRWARIDLVGVAAWVAASGVGIATTVSPWFTGPLARGVLAQGSFGFVFALAAAAALSTSGWRLTGWMKVAANRCAAGTCGKPN